MNNPDFQDDMFGEAVPVFPSIPSWLKTWVENIWPLYNTREPLYKNQRIADDDLYLQIMYWKVFDGLDEVFETAETPEDAFFKLEEWYVSGRPTSPETINRSRRWLTQDREGGAYMRVSPAAKSRRAKNEQMMRSQIREQ